MKINKIMITALAAVIAVSICGCKGDPQNKSNDSGTMSDESSENSVNTPSYSVPDDATFLKGAAGDVIGASEITQAWNNDGQEISPELLTEENFFKAATDGAYYALPLYHCFTDRDSEYDMDNLLFKDAPQGSQSDFIKVKKGDKVCGLTVSEAYSEFDLSSPVPGVVVGTNLSLDGEITLTGYARVIPENEYGVSAGDIVFIPTGSVNLPVVRFDGCGSDGVITRRTGDVYIMDGGTESITYTNEFADRFTLGNVNAVSADISCLSGDGSFTKVNVTISGITMRSTINWITQIKADIKNISAAD